MSYELTQTLIHVTQLKPVQAKEAQRHILLVYMLIGWGSPTVVTVVCVIVNYTTDYIRYGKESYYWIKYTDSLYIVFMTPIAMSIIFNGISFSVTSYLLIRAWINKAKLHKKSSTSYFRIYLSVFSITGLTWMFGFVAILSRGDWVWYLFIIFTSTQGFTICVAFLFTQKVGSRYKMYLWTKVSWIFSFNRTLRQGTHYTSMTMQYSRNSENVGTALSECTTGKQLETGPTKDLEKHEAEEYQE